MYFFGDKVSQCILSCPGIPHLDWPRAPIFVCLLLQESLESRCVPPSSFWKTEPRLLPSKPRPRRGPRPLPSEPPRPSSRAPVPWRASPPLAVRSRHGEPRGRRAVAVLRGRLRRCAGGWERGGTPGAAAGATERHGGCCGYGGRCPHRGEVRGRLFTTTEEARTTRLPALHAGRGYSMAGIIKKQILKHLSR